MANKIPLSQRRTTSDDGCRKDQCINLYAALATLVVAGALFLPLLKQEVIGHSIVAGQWL